jgi:hypothetical protein
VVRRKKSSDLRLAIFATFEKGKELQEFQEVHRGEARRGFIRLLSQLDSA